MGQPAFLGRSADHVAGQQLNLPQVLVFVEHQHQHRVPPTSEGSTANFRVFNPAARVSEVNQCRIAGASCHGHLESTYTVGTEHLAANEDAFQADCRRRNGRKPGHVSEGQVRQAPTARSSWRRVGLVLG
jgi:hypothetical protein